MRALRVVGITEGGDVVLEDSSGRERFTVAADDQLRAALRGDLPRLGQIAIESESQLRPREIQARIRAGASVEQVASAAGVSIQKIERFAYPVLLERSRTAEVAQRAHPMRADGPDARMLGDVVADTFGLRGQEYSGVEWDSWKGEDGRWVVVLSWRAGHSDNQAHWTFQPGANGGTVTAVDEHASDLVEGLPMRPLRPVGPVIDIARPEEPAPAPARGRAEGLRATATDTAPTAPVEPRVTETGRGSRTEQVRERPAARATPPEQRRPEPPAQRQAEPRVEPRPESRPEPRIESRPESRPESRAAESRPEPRPGAPDEPPAAAVEEPAEQPETGPAAGKRTKKGKPVMPSWDEVLLGVRGQR